MNNPKQPRTVNISVQWDNIDSINLAERNKATLENKGYTLVNHFGGPFRSTMVYMLLS